MNQEIIIKLRQIKEDINISPEFNTTASMKAGRIVDSVLNVFLKTGTNVINWAGCNNSSNQVMSKFGLGVAGRIKNKLSIFTDINNVQNKVRVSRMIDPRSKEFIIIKLEEIKRIR